MPASTRQSNKDASFKVYYSKKVPKQVYFPHRRKVVREKKDAEKRDGGGGGGEGAKQLRFLPEMMRRRDTRGSEEGEREEEAKQEAGEGEAARRPRSGRGTKRSSDVMRDSEGEEETEDEDPVRPAPKRIRECRERNAIRCTPVVSVESGSTDRNAERESSASHSSESGSETENEEDNMRPPRLRRQSTMTQLVDGRRPRPGDKEPEFRPVKRMSRSSWGRGKSKEKDDKQRTLTQMVPGWGTVFDSEDEETEDEEAGAHAEVLAEPLSESRVLEAVSEDHTRNNQDLQKEGIGPRDVEDNEDDYLPTQDVRPSAIAKRRTPRRSSNAFLATPATSTARKTPRSRFGLLATPERRKIFEIPSSQSPPDSPLSTQQTPGSRKSALRQRSANTPKSLDTPSKRKRVAFQENVEMAKTPALSRKFSSTVQDSEDEYMDELGDETEDDAGLGIGAETQNMINAIDNVAAGRDVGTETQAILDQIDQACAIAREDEVLQGREESPELGCPGVEAVNEEGSQEIGEPVAQGKNRSPSAAHDDTSCPSGRTDIKQEPLEENVTALASPTGTSTEAERGTSSHPVPTGMSRRTDIPVRIKEEDTHDTFPPSRGLIKQEQPDSQLAPPPTPLPEASHMPPPATCEPTDLDGLPIQVHRSPTPPDRNPETQESNRSFSSKAEHQLQSEWLSFSQYPRPPPSSSMHVLQDISSYQQQTPRSEHTTMRAPVLPTEWSAGAPLSQATTVDPDADADTDVGLPSQHRSQTVTPRKARSHIPSATTTATSTPRKLVPSSQPVISPQRPATLVIPSSFPSPGRVSLGGWSSPVRGGGSLTDGGGGESGSLASEIDFSIPPGPPGGDDEGDVDTDEEEL